MFDRTDIPMLKFRALPVSRSLGNRGIQKQYGREDNFRVLSSGSSFLSSLPGVHFCYSGVLTEDGYTCQAFRIV